MAYQEFRFYIWSPFWRNWKNFLIHLRSSNFLYHSPWEPAADEVLYLVLMRNCGGAIILFFTASNVLLHGRLGPDFQLANAINPPATNRGRGWQRDVKGARKEELVGRIQILFSTKCWYLLGIRAKILYSQRKKNIVVVTTMFFFLLGNTHYPCLVSRSYIFACWIRNLSWGQANSCWPASRRHNLTTVAPFSDAVRLNPSCGSCQCGHYQILSLEVSRWSKYILGHSMVSCVISRES